MAQWSEVIDRAKHALLDPEHTRWSEPELLFYAQDALRMLVKAKPDQYGTTGVWETQPGSRQQLPAEAESLLSVLAETDSGGHEKRSVRFVDEEVLDSFVPSWRSGESEDLIANYLHDARDPRTYYLYPGPADERHIFVRFVRVPTLPETVEDSIDARDEYIPALLDYVLYRAFMKDADDTRNEQRAMAHLELFNMAIGGHGQNQALLKPRANEPPAQGAR